MKNILLFIIYLSVPSLLASQIDQTTNISKSNKQLTSIAIDAYLDHLEAIHQDFSGQILIYRNGKEISYHSRGYANAEFKVKGNRNTKYNLASISKLLTAVVVLKMQEEELVDINLPIGNYIEEFRETSVGETTIYELSTHTSGLPEKYESYLWKFVHVEKHNFKIDSLINHLKDIKINKEDKGKTDYTNLGPILTALALERITDQPYPLLLKKYLIDPLDLEDTGLAIITDQDEIIENKAKTYEFWYWSLYEFPFAKVGLLGAAAGLHSSINDLQKVINTIFIRKDYLSPESYKILTEPYTEDSEYSFGCFDMQFTISPDKEIKVLGHEGFIWGASTAALYIPESQLGFIMLSNKNYSVDLESDLRKMISLLYGGEVERNKMGLENRIMEAKDDKEFFSFVNGLNDLAKLEKDYSVEEYNINDLGYSLMAERYQYKRAEALFKLNCRLYPESSNTYDSLGEIQYILKDFEGALKNYKKSLELDPENENATEYIQKITAHKNLEMKK